MRLKLRPMVPVRRALRAVTALYAPYFDRLRRYTDPTVSRLRTRYERLEPREKLLVQIATAMVVLLLGYNLIYLPIQAMRQNLGQEIETRQQELIEVRRLVQNYEQVKLDLAAAKKRTVSQKDFSLFSALEGMLTDKVGVSKIGSINPGGDKNISKDLVQHSVEISLKSLTLTELVNTLHGIQTLPVPVLISAIQIRHSDDFAEIFDVNLTCIALGGNV